jgi:dTMP kinase
MLVTLEGLDGAGKSTCMQTLRDAEGLADAVFTREPTDTWYGDAVERSIGDPEADPLAELFLYTADHAAHLANTVRPALQRDRIVVSDRYSDSRYAYQGVSLAEYFDDSVAFVQGVHEPWTRPPDATIYLDVDPETAAERSGATNKFETVEYLQKVRENYERLIDAEPDRFHRVDATRPAQAVRTEVLDRVEELIE